MIESIEKALGAMDVKPIDYVQMACKSHPKLIKALRVAVGRLADLGQPGSGPGGTFFANKTLEEIASILSEAP